MKRTEEPRLVPAKADTRFELQSDFEETYDTKGANGIEDEQRFNELASNVAANLPGLAELMQLKDVPLTFGFDGRQKLFDGLLTRLDQQAAAG